MNVNLDKKEDLDQDNIDFPMISLDRKIKDTMGHSHHKLPDSLERTSLSSSNVAKTGLYDNI
jgi:hypothetical protein